MKVTFFNTTQLKAINKEQYIRVPSTLIRAQPLKS